MTPPDADTVLLRYGELGTKSSRVRGRMVTTLCENVDALLADRGLPGETEYRMARPVVHVDGTDGDAAAGDTAVVETVARAAADAMGVVSTSPALRVAPEREAILDALAETARATYDAGTFAVRVQRADETLPFTSPELEREGGTAVWEAVSDRFDPEVDLDDPDHVLAVEARSDVAYVFTERIAGPGGLPLGTQRPLAALVSGGLDSPVAAYEAMRRGSRLAPVYLDLGDYGGADHRARAVESVRSLSRYDPELDGLFVVPGGETVARLVETLDSGRMLAFRRYAFRVAEELAHRSGGAGIVTGEAVGQKSSQTAANLAVTSAAVDLPVHRPLLTVDKTEIVDRARAVGTFEDATVAAGCDRLAPDQAETNASLDWLRGREPDDLFERAERDADAAEWVEW
jgi:thiamine biosynthesis protein ThiI